MQPSLTKILISPITGKRLQLSESVKECGEVMEGCLTCENTGQTFPIKKGIPYFAPAAATSNSTARRFGYQWKQQSRGAFEKETIYGESSEQELQHFLSATRLAVDLRGLRIADIGCGRGRLSRSLAEHGAEVFAIDISASVEVAKLEGKHLSRLHVLQADLFRLPLPDGFFDVVWSDGVIHHTPNPRAAFSALAAKVAVGGRLVVYVYPQEVSIYKRVRSWIPTLHKWPLPLLRTFCSITAVPIHLARIIVRRYQPYREVKFRLFDTVACPYLSMHAADEVTGWFEENGFQQIAVGAPAITAFGIKAPT